MAQFASGKIALAICDVCGLTCKYTDLQELVRDKSPTGVKACKDCFDPDHPQYRVDDLVVDDAIALEDPRPDVPRADFTDVTLVPAISTLFIDQ